MALASIVPMIEKTMHRLRLTLGDGKISSPELVAHFTNKYEGLQAILVDYRQQLNNATTLEQRLELAQKIEAEADPMHLRAVSLVTGALRETE